MMKSMLPLVALSFGVLSCTGDDDEPTDTTDDDNGTTDETEETEDTSTDPLPPPAEINAFDFFATFAFDQATGTIASFVDTSDPDNPETVRPYFFYSFYAFDPQSGTIDPDNFCGAQVFLDTGTFAPWATGDVYYGVDVQPVEVEHDCDDNLFLADLAGVIDSIETAAMGVGIGVLSEAMLDIFEDENIEYDEDPEDSDYNQYTIGGYYQIPFYEPYDDDYPYDPNFTAALGYGFELDENLELVTTPDEDGDGYDEAVIIPAADIAPTASGIPTAVYQTSSFYLYYFY